MPYDPGAQGVGLVREADTLPPGQQVWFICATGMKSGDGSMAGCCVIDESSVLVFPAQIENDLATVLGLSVIAA